MSTFQARLIRKCSVGNILYKTLKYLASVSGQHFPSYFIKVKSPVPTATQDKISFVITRS